MLRGTYLDGVVRIEYELDELLADVFEPPVLDGRAFLLKRVVLQELGAVARVNAVSRVIEFATIDGFEELVPDLRRVSFFRNRVVHDLAWLPPTGKADSFTFQGFRRGKQVTESFSYVDMSHRVDELYLLLREIRRLRIELARSFGYDAPDEFYGAAE